MKKRQTKFTSRRERWTNLVTQINFKEKKRVVYCECKKYIFYTFFGFLYEEVNWQRPAKKEEENVKKEREVKKTLGLRSH